MSGKLQNNHCVQTVQPKFAAKYSMQSLKHVVQLIFREHRENMDK